MDLAIPHSTLAIPLYIPLIFVILSLSHTYNVIVTVYSMIHPMNLRIGLIPLI